MPRVLPGGGSKGRRIDHWASVIDDDGYTGTAETRAGHDKHTQAGDNDIGAPGNLGGVDNHRPTRSSTQPADHTPPTTRIVTKLTEFPDALLDPQQIHGYAYAHNNPTVFSDPSGLKDDEEAGAVQKSINFKTSPPVAITPVVGNQRLQDHLKNIYARPGQTNVVGDGTVGAAILEEFRTGVPTKGLWHYEKAADTFTGLSKLLEEDRKARVTGKPPILTDGERQIAHDEARRLWGALNATDVAKGFSREMSRDPAGYDRIKNVIAIGAGNSAVADIVGTDWTDQVYKGKVIGTPHQTSPPKYQGVAKGLFYLDVAAFGVQIFNYGFEGAVRMYMEDMLWGFGAEMMNKMHPCAARSGYDRCAA